MANINQSNLSAETYDSAYFNRLWFLIKNKRYFLFLTVLALTSLTAIDSLFDIPRYVSEYQLQVDTYNLGKSAQQKSPMMSSDLMSGRTLVNSSVLLLKSDLFLSNLAEEIQKSESKNEIIIVKNPGFRINFEYALLRMGLIRKIKFSRIDVTALKPNELGDILGTMLEIIPNYSDKLVILKIKTLDPKTAFLINKLVMGAYTKAMAKLNQKQLESTISFYTEQVKTARSRLDNAEDSLTQFLRSHPTLASDSTKTAFLQSYNDLQTKTSNFKMEIEVNSSLYNYYKNKYVSFDDEGDSNLDLINRLKQELVELKYKKQVFKEKEYDDLNPGIINLNKQIKNIERLINKNSSAFKSNKQIPVVSLSYLERISGKLEELQDLIRTSKFNLASVERQTEELRPKINAILQHTITLEELRREVDFSVDMYKEYTKSLEMVKQRADGEDAVIAAVNEPTLDHKPINLPAGRRILFAFFIGLALAMSFILLQESFSPKVIDRHSVEAMGSKYAGVLDSQIANQAEILSVLGCLDDPKAGKGPKIILCASPIAMFQLKHVNLLSKYLSKHRRRTLTIVISDIVVSSEYQMTDDMGYAKIYRHSEGYEDIVQITDPDTFSSMRSLLDQFGSKYHIIFIFVAEAVSNLAYHMAQRVAKQLLLVGEIAEYSAHDYMRLMRGFTIPSEVYITLMPPKKEIHVINIVKYFNKNSDRTIQPPSTSPPGQASDTLKKAA